MQTHNLPLPRIHFIENDGQFYPLGSDPSIIENGFWKNLDIALAEDLIGGNIYFHHTKSGPSYMSGRIVGVRPSNSNERADSIVFQFRQHSPPEVINAGEEGWEQRYRSYRKIVFR